jgi:GTP pyrophosphokinase
VSDVTDLPITPITPATSATPTSATNKPAANKLAKQLERWWFGEEVAAHIQGVVDIAQVLKLDEPTLAACQHLDSALSEEQMSKQYGAEVTQMIRGYQALQVAREKAHNGQAETLRKMLLAFSQDLRVVLIYLASRLQTLRFTIAQKMTVERSWAQELLDIDASLANRLGIWQLKWEMEDLAFRHLEPQTYKSIAKLLDAKRRERQDFVEHIIDRLKEELQHAHIEADVQGRPKHIYSIWKKMQGKSLDFADLYDVRAFRVLVKDLKDCYAVLGLVHHLWQPVPREFDDYIARPKPNGYQSLHTVVMDSDDISFEIQIRTHEMHHQAEYGVAAHWRYKEGVYRGGNVSGTVSAAVEYEQRIAWARQLISWKEDAWDQLKGQSIDDHLYVLTPLGQVIALDAGSTPIDFAYAVHTNLGHRCRGARVDGAMVPLDTPLKNGQTVEIIAVKTGGPSRDWLLADRGYLASHRAKSRVRAWFNAQELELDKDSKDKDKDKDKDREEKLKLASALPENANQAEMILKPSRSKSKQGDVLVVGVDSLLTQLSKCCRPVPPDPISGFVTKGRGVSIHRKDCATLRQLELRAPERVILTQWGERAALGDPKHLFPAEVVVQAIDRQGLLRDISEVFAKIKINVVGVRTQSKKGLANMHFSIEIPRVEDLYASLNALMEVRGVTEARRK